MESNNNDNYVLVLEDRTEVKNANETGKLSVVSGIDDKGKLQTTEAKDVHQAAFLKFNNKDGLLKNFMTNFLKQFNEPSRFGLYKVVANNVEQGVASLHTMLQNREKPENKQQLADSQVRFDDFLPKQKNATAIDESKIDWKQLDNLGLTRERLEQSGELVKMLGWQKSNLITIAIPIGDTTIYTDARLAFRTDGEGNIGLAVHPLRKEPQLDFPYMGHKFSNEEKELLLATGNLGKTIEITPKNGDPFAAYVSIDPQTNELIALRADRVNIPKEIKGVTLSDAQYKGLVEGKAVKVEGMTAKSGKSFNATLQVNAEKKGIEFIFENKQGLKERQQHTQQQGAPRKLCGLELSDKQREALDSGRTLYLKNMVDKEGQPFNAYVKMDKEQNRPRFYKWNPDKKQETGKEKVVAVAEEHKTQVAVNNQGKTNEATKNVNEPLKSGQTQPTAAQKQKQDEKKQQRRGRKM
ncbi:MULTISPECIES: DUF4099 domain-containing protein [Bacteroidales]|jgi:hypothetical protein|uniref:DUF3945 domain-containing protein n=2 Tax=Prevotellaceae TaxID=171552 RepID=D7NCP7_9BACT|nr:MULTISPECIES: DUF4099 domain-containing protein [Prevotellaceae]BES60133.1 DUF3945 domain-containing protein [Dysgonomonas capnocytophagoides]EFC73207.1 hypothetical protein HMPREF0660_01063 [Prevotella melaninogenica D18]EFI48935.1 conserved hypothetical protein [Segatella oris C735]ELX67855.1 hypothetical protein HMPREF0662_00829 [Prevotella nigrescens F0103]QKH89133.1 DUF3945 domain-containing protein [Prevotella melaninogenica]